MGNSKSRQQLSERPLDHPLALTSTAEIVALQSVPPRRMGVMEETGRVFQNDASKTVVGWVDANGIAYRNDYNRTVVGRIDLSTGYIYSADYNKTLVGRVDETGKIYFMSTVVHNSGTNTPVGQIEGPTDSYKFAACAFLTLW